MATFRNTDEAEILEAVLAFYRDRLSLGENSVFPTVEPLNPPVAPPGGEFWIHCAIGDGEFPFEEQDDEQLRMTVSLTAVAFTRMQYDQANKELAFLLDRQKGAPALKKKLLLLVGEELTAEDEGLIASRVYARRSLKATYDPTEAVGWAGIVFGIDFDWDVPGAEDLGDG